MYITSALLLAAGAGIAHAQTTPKGFTPSTNTKLEVFFNSASVATPGQLLSKNTTATEPKLAISSAAGNLSDTYMFVMLDLDVPPQQGSATRRVLLHAMQTGFKATQQKISGAATLLASTQQGPAAYLAPGPPATDTIAHRYVQLLFKQPAALKVQAADFANTTGRFNFDVNKFMSENKVGAPIAGNFFTVDGRANSTATGGTATPSGAKPSRTIEPFTGAAGRREVSYGLAVGVSGLAMLLV
ncbi:PEBP-like protein [Setomelanomma holmii]|uniref:PEBP-like protein n=1 Tax=Setomelanomma holmii TaxID=210430 RepID=A0A9P4GZV5_9PLEO|nr:PEBP-like protein [Setomelanomma holmii]